jgi:hypothetical protein
MAADLAAAVGAKTEGGGVMYRIRNRSGMGIADPGIPTHWWCPVPGAPVSYLEQMFGCPSVGGVAPVGAQPSDPLVNEIVYDPSTYTPPVVAPIPAVDAGTSTTPAPYACLPGDTANPNCPGYDAAVAAAIAQQHAANASALNQVAANIRAAIQAGCPNDTLVANADGSLSCPSIFAGLKFPGLPSWALIAGIAVVGVFALSVVGGGSPRRYGR